jgi:hypothetical protein
MRGEAAQQHGGESHQEGRWNGDTVLRITGHRFARAPCGYRSPGRVKHRPVIRYQTKRCPDQGRNAGGVKEEEGDGTAAMNSFLRSMRMIASSPRRPDSRGIRSACFILEQLDVVIQLMPRGASSQENCYCLAPAAKRRGCDWKKYFLIDVTFRRLPSPSLHKAAYKCGGRALAATIAAQQLARSRAIPQSCDHAARAE